MQKAQHQHQQEHHSKGSKPAPEPGLIMHISNVPTTILPQEVKVKLVYFTHLTLQQAILKNYGPVAYLDLQV